MNVKKAAEAVGSGVPNGVQLDAINALAKGTMTAEQVYVFSVKLCDDQVDRDGERFDTAALPELARLFIGKTGIMDHCWSAERQIARIFETQVVKEDGISYIKAWAYIRRGEENDGVIADIEAGIKKEVSVGCAMGRAVCSICGSDYGSCGHRKGEDYDGMTCCAILMEPMDAYEFSFVAVPAQPQAGVLKGMGAGKKTLKELADQFGVQAEYRCLYKLAELGKQYTTDLQNDVVRLCLALQLGVAEPVLRSIVSLANAEDLMKMRAALQKRFDESMPVQSQLSLTAPRTDALESGYLI